MAVCLQVTVGVHLTIPGIARAVQNRKSAENISCTGSQWLETSATIMCVSSFFFRLFHSRFMFYSLPSSSLARQQTSTELLGSDQLIPKLTCLLSTMQPVDQRPPYARHIATHTLCTDHPPIACLDEPALSVSSRSWLQSAWWKQAFSTTSSRCYAGLRFGSDEGTRSC